ncbi:hypothetical protein LSH36_883g00062 [Paralvinella palmiformis]|uniref:G-protein coupled receptors family 1 profile domain-containing protein n=1 Tax=Paralvinella palmiformis TaxID=53620 RepID=A0AAD9MTA7_9ANNE|nr:hypothetical protein LSH36_883g00062 [Paralvinella palmiformis]
MTGQLRYDQLNTSCDGIPTAVAHSAQCAANDSVDPNVQFYETAQFITGIILYPIIIVIGLTGNTLTMIVLSHNKMLTSTNVFLTALSVSDIIKLLNDTLYFLVSILLRRHPLAGNRMLGCMYPFSHYVFNESVCVSAWLTVSVAVERYISVCHATKARVVCTIHRARIISALVFVSMSLVAVPSAFRYKGVRHRDVATNATTFSIELSALGRNRRFMTVYTWIQNLFRSIIPLFVLIVLNALIIQALRQERISGKRMSARNRITLMLIVVILVFIICIFPDAIMSTVFGFGYVDESSLVKGIREFTDVLLSLNSAVNFMIYCFCSRSFRTTSREIFCQRFVNSRQLYHSVRSKVSTYKETPQADIQMTYNGHIRYAEAERLDLVAMTAEDALLVSNGHQMAAYSDQQLAEYTDQQLSAYTGPQTYL